jgi:hypothetical protein
MMTVTVSIDDFKKAIHIAGYDSLAEWMREQRNPEGKKVTRTNLYRAINDGTPGWLLEKVIDTIKKSKENHPDVWN